MEIYRQRTGKMNYADIPGRTVGQQPGQQTQTFRITKSISKSSLANGDAEGNINTNINDVSAVDRMNKPAPPQRPPRPDLTRRPTEDSPLNPFKEGVQPSYATHGGMPNHGDPLSAGGGGYHADDMQMRNRDEYRSYNRYED